jgi:hypothetical protein
MNTALARTSPNRAIDNLETCSLESASAWAASISNLMRHTLTLQQTWIEALALSTSRMLELWNPGASLSSSPFKFSPFDWLSQIVETNVAIQGSFLKLFTKEADIVLTEVATEAESFVHAMDVVVESSRELEQVKPFKPQPVSLAKAAS